MSTYNICFCGEIRKIFTGYPPLSRPMVAPCLSLICIDLISQIKFLD